MAKLLKYEWKSTGWNLVWLTLGLLVSEALFVALFRWKIPVISEISIVFAVLLPSIYSVGVMVYLWVDYYQSMYGRQAYLTHALPLRGSLLYQSKVLYYAMTNLISLIVLAVAYLSVFWLSFPSQHDEIRDAWNRAVTNFGLWKIVVIAVIFAVFYAVSYVLIGTFIITLARGPRLNHLGPITSIIVMAVIAYVLNQLAGLIGIMAVPFGVTTSFDPQFVFSFSEVQGTFVNNMFSSTASADPPGVVPLGFLITYSILYLIMGLAARNQVEEHTSLR